MTLLHSPGAVIATKMLTTMRACHETHPYTISFLTHVAIFFPSSFWHATPPHDIDKTRHTQVAAFHINVDGIMGTSARKTHDDDRNQLSLE